MAVFLTGATGFLGTEVVSSLLRRTGETIYVLVRGENEEAAAHRLKMFWYEKKELYGRIGSRILPLAGDFTRPDLGLPPSIREMLRGRISMIFHLGAETGIQKSRSELMAANRTGTRNVLRFAKKVDDGGSLRRFVLASTAYTAGLRSGLILESDPAAEQFATYYEQSKGLAEKLVRESGLPCTICRPGMIVGHSETGWIRQFNTIYYVLKLMLQGKGRLLPVSPGQKVNIVPVDYVADGIVRLSGDPGAVNACFHLTLPEEKKPAAGELADRVRLWARENLDLSLPRPLFLPMPALKKAGLAHNRRTGEKQRNYLSNLAALMPYFFDDKVFDRTNTDRLLGTDVPDWKIFLDPVLRFACRHNFMHLTDRTVHEQILFRLTSTSAPISCFDILADEVRETTGPEMAGKIEQIRLALMRLGVRKGDRVALTGINCTDYFALDTAVGLCGGVTVPVYYTTPAADIDLLLKKSGAGWFFIGDRRIMEQIDALESPLPLIAFGSALSVPAGHIKRRSFTAWKDFLAVPDPAGAEDAEEAGTGMAPSACSPGGPPASVRMDPEDLATIRYTSGTTGEPKGVMFNAAQLAWMGQVMTALLPWKEKQHEMRYLSFLPLSHVVEGILASNAPYYVHCPVKYYYLNDFDRLTEALPLVRPNVFFSVPRFYEKLWQQIGESPAGKRWLAMPDGLRKKAFGRVIKRAVLKKAGLDQCSQLIVGSAPVSRNLLSGLRALGIEVYNAYGQTEAPLITINHRGDNVIPSVGTPLPDTRVTVQEDGELIVEGPQVCLGYYGLETEAIRDGILRTGDLGSIDESGHVFLTGRKKEMIITSYGKNINSARIEALLKSIPGISEAVLIGENRPYCTALLWAGGTVSPAALSAAIKKMNRGLSHPEQVRKWTLLKTPLRIQKGELTPNLKVRRSAVEEHYRSAIEKMYL